MTATRAITTGVIMTNDAVTITTSIAGTVSAGFFSLRG
jgi:hypothetical protein